jgi:hypothetical protein
MTRISYRGSSQVAVNIQIKVIIIFMRFLFHKLHFLVCFAPKLIMMQWICPLSAGLLDVDSYRNEVDGALRIPVLYAHFECVLTHSGGPVLSHLHFPRPEEFSVPREFSPSNVHVLEHTQQKVKGRWRGCFAKNWILKVKFWGRVNNEKEKE